MAVIRLGECANIVLVIYIHPLRGESGRRYGHPMLKFGSSMSLLPCVSRLEFCPAYFCQDVWWLANRERPSVSYCVVVNLVVRMNEHGSRTLHLIQALLEHLGTSCGLVGPLEQPSGVVGASQASGGS